MDNVVGAKVVIGNKVAVTNDKGAFRRAESLQNRAQRRSFCTAM